MQVPTEGRAQGCALTCGLRAPTRAGRVVLTTYLRGERQYHKNLTKSRRMFRLFCSPSLKPNTK
jgi:hypothetical protein